ncbi:T9SS type B sorting domain-containing protein [Flavobacterium sp. WW92]|nr:MULTISPECIES: T9SS type B sorting domain-containing protein [unclassified Flavobacterium]WDO14614.1 T9SS type B sorting domain-containing protein [Flavobacterium sp. WW92]
MTATTTYTLVEGRIVGSDNTVICSQSLSDGATVTENVITAQITTSDTPICEGVGMTVDVQGTPGAIVTYTNPSGTQQTLTLDAAGAGTIAIAASLAPGTYTYTLVKASTASTPPCEQNVSDSVTITVVPLPTATITRIDAQVCLGSQSRIRINGQPLAHVDYTLNGTPQPQIQIDATGEYILLETLPAAGTYDYELVRVTSDAAPFCTQPLSETITVTVIAAPSATISTASPVICEGGSATVDFSGTLDADVAYTVNGGAPQTIRLSTPSAADPAIGEASITQVLSADTRYALVSVATTGAVPCSAALTGFIDITVTPLPTGTIAATDATVCEGTGTTIIFTGPAGGTVTYAIGAGAGTTATLDAAGTYSLPTGNLSAGQTYRLLGVSTGGAVPCSRTLNLQATVSVKALPTAVITGPANVCSNRTAELEITGTPGATVSFTWNAGADTDTVLLDGAGYALYTTQAITATTTFSLASAVSGGTPSCTAALAGSVTITPIAAPVIFNPTPLEVCDDNTDGIAVFDLTDKDLEITGGPSTLIVTYHETEQNAIDNAFPKQGFPYSNLVDASPEQAPYIMWVRVEEPGGSQCPSFTQLRLIVNRTPQPTAPGPIEICDDATADGLATFPDIGIREPDMILGLNPLDTYTFAYYINEADAKADIPANPPIGSVFNFNNTTPYSQIIWVRVSTPEGCFKAVPLELKVNPNPVIPGPGLVPEYSVCDDPSQDGYETFDLEGYKPRISAAPGLDIQYYFDDAALAAGTPLPLSYQNQVMTVQTIIVGVTNTATGCFSRTTLTLRVQPLPLINIPAQIPTACDPDGNATEQFDLDALIPEITGGAPYIVTFHETEQNAEDGVFPYTSPYSNLASGIIWIRATDPSTGCYSVAPLQLIVNPVPVVPAQIDDLVVCDTNADGTTRVDLQAHAEQDLLDAQLPGNYTVRFYTLEADAEAGLGGAIATPASYPATNGQTIWVRVTNTDTGCYNVGSFTVVINPALSFAPVEYSLCDDALPNDGFTVFDLTSQNGNLTGGLPGYSVAFYTLAGTLIDPADAYTNQSPGAQTLNVVITNDATTCVSRTTLTIRVEPLPNPRTDPQDIESCDNGTPGDGISEGIDLTVNEGYIRNNANPASVAFYYYTDEATAIADGNQGTTYPNAIPDPTDYDGPAGTIYVLMTTNANNPSARKCYQVVRFELIVNPLPALGDNGDIDDFVACVGGSTNTFVLSSHNIEVIADGLDVADYTFTYYHTQPEAEAAVPGTELPDSYPNATNPETVWVNVRNNTTGCYSVGTFDLIVDEPAVANPVTDPALITKCDTDGTNDGLADFDLTAFDATVLGTQPAGDFTVHYYDDRAEAEADGDLGITSTNPNALTGLNPYHTATVTIYALVINRTSTTGCPAIVAIPLTVNRLPEVTLEGGFYCVDPVTLDPLNTFTLTAVTDNGANPADYTYVWTRDGGVLPDTGSTLVVDEQGSYTVTATNIATGCVSEPSDAAIVTATSAAIITDVTVTNAFTDNATITVVVDPTSLGDYEYKLDEGPWQQGNVFAPVSAGDHIVYVRDRNDGGCQDSQPVPVSVIDYPNYFTPNADGYNDTWNIIGLAGQPEASIYIFDRYGKLVKQISPAGSGWDGTMNGRPLPSTDYWFKVLYQENGTGKEFKAHFSLKR